MYRATLAREPSLSARQARPRVVCEENDPSPLETQGRPTLVGHLTVDLAHPGRTRAANSPFTAVRAGPGHVVPPSGRYRGPGRLAIDVERDDGAAPTGRHGV